MKVICLFNSISGGTTKYKIYDVIKELIYLVCQSIILIKIMEVKTG